MIAGLCRINEFEELGYKKEICFDFNEFNERLGRVLTSSKGMYL